MGEMEIEYKERERKRERRRVIEILRVRCGGKAIEGEKRERESGCLKEKEGEFGKFEGENVGVR